MATHCPKVLFSSFPDGGCTADLLLKKKENGGHRFRRRHVQNMNRSRNTTMYRNNGYFNTLAKLISRPSVGEFSVFGK